MSIALSPVAGKQTEILSHVLNSLRTSESSDSPFSHFYATTFFPPDFYADLISNLPAEASYSPMATEKRRLADGTCTRKFYQLDEAGVAALPSPAAKLWKTVYDILLSDEFKQGVFDVLKEDLAYRFSISPDEVVSIEGSPRLRLIRDVPGYSIAPHPDTRKKIVTMMIYLPSDESQADLGTSLYARQLSVRGITSKADRFKEVKRFPFHPNTSFAFAVNNTVRKKSWHGRELIESGSGIRNSLVTTFYRPGTFENENY